MKYTPPVPFYVFFGAVPFFAFFDTVPYSNMKTDCKKGTGDVPQDIVNEIYKL